MLIANRGEIAVRVIRTCQDIGISTVAVYSETDYDSLHVRLADEAYALPGVSPAQSYLNIEAVMHAIERSGADAIHPGYGFLSENADFARAVTENGVVFVGPPPKAIEVMGDKVSARNAAHAAGVASVPGDTTPISDPAQIEAFATTHGWPIAVKAAYGGGGRGMKVINSLEEAGNAIDSAKREAKAYFGRDELYVERYLPQPRHVEVQILADTYGSCIHLGTRDCSAQRRHQKLVEEAPAPAIPEDILEAMGKSAMKVALGCGYVNAGTVEFLYHDESFYYLEMNTRLQVEHPVTEAVTGIDLVEQQLRVAAGEPLRFKQDDVSISGHAIEVRVNAEDPANGAFLPAPGRIDRLRPAQGFGIRWDGGYESGDEVSQYYDNLIGKLVVWGSDRSNAIARTRRALAEMVVTGVPTTISAGKLIVAHNDFTEVSHSTKWVEEQLYPEVSEETGIQARTLNDDLNDSEVADDGEVDVAESRSRHEIDVEVNGKRFTVVMWVPETMWVPDGAAIDHLSRGISTPAQRGGSKTSGIERSGIESSVGATEGAVVIPMQGTVVQIPVNTGDTVEAGDTVIVLEAMKMENNLTTKKSGTVTEIRVSIGDSVGVGDIAAIVT